MAEALKSSQGVLTTLLTATVVYTAFIYISTVGQSIHGVAFVAQTLKTTRGVHTCVITCALKKTLIYILTRTFISQQFEAFSAVTLKASYGVSAEVFTPTIVELTLIYIFACFSIWLQSETNRAAAAHTCGCVFTGAVTPPIVHCTRFHKESSFNPFVHLSEECSIVICRLSRGLISFYT